MADTPRDADDVATALRLSGFAHCSVLDLDVVRRRLGVNQQGDDEAALTLALRRYVVVVASADASLARGILQRPEVVVRKMEAADATQAKDAYIAAMGDDNAIRKHAKRQCSMLDTLPAFVATLNATVVGVVALDEKGRDLTSEKLAGILGDWRDGGIREARFLIGAADGHSEQQRDEADLLLAFGSATWPHLLARAMLAEQLYRATSILAGHPYHRAG